MKTSSQLINFLKKQYYPSEEIKLLQIAQIAPQSIAKIAWDEWRSLDRLDDITWQEHKLLARMYHRINALDPHYPHLARVSGLLKSEWAKSQVRLKECLSAIDLLLEHQYPLMLFKGFAWNQNENGIRLSGDLDILVPENHFFDVLELLEKNHWYSEGKKHWRKKQNVHAINLVNAKGGNIDIHRRPFHTTPPKSYINGIWERSRDGEFMGRYVRYCSEADYLAILIAHGVVGQQKKHTVSTWPGDIHYFLSQINNPTISLFRSIIVEIGKPVECHLALSYLKDDLYSESASGLSEKILPFDISLITFVRSTLNSPHAFKKGGAIWFFASFIRRILRLKNFIFANKST